MRSFPLAIVACVCALAPIGSQAQKLISYPQLHHFHYVQVGSSSSFSFILTNAGNSLLSITSATVSGSGFSLGTFRVPIKIKPGASVQLPVTFTPTQAGRVQGTAKVVSNDPNSPLAITLFGTGTGGGNVLLQISPSTLNFGNVTVGQTASLPATLTASGGDVTVSSDRTNSSEFSITGLNLPVTIPSGSSVQATMQFTPNSSGQADAKAGFFSNAHDSPAFEELTGTGVSQNPPPHEVDLTWNAGDPNVAGYNMYRGMTHGGPYQEINSSLILVANYTDTNVSSGQTYYYVATEVNNQGQESGYSNETQAQIP